MAEPQDLTGQTFHSLRVVGLSSKRSGNSRCWRCICVCGAETAVPGYDLKSGNSKSCGCLRSRLLADRKRTHGMSGSPEYNAWANMIARCYNPKTVTYPHYGGRGITICQPWRESFAAFLADMGKRPGPGYSIERKKNGEGYNPQNCCWATRVTQANNSRKNRFITHDNRTLTVAQWSAETGISYAVLYQRFRHGWPAVEIITTPVTRSRLNVRRRKKPLPA